MTSPTSHLRYGHQRQSIRSIAMVTALAAMGATCTQAWTPAVFPTNHTPQRQNTGVLSPRNGPSSSALSVRTPAANTTIRLYASKGGKDGGGVGGFLSKIAKKILPKKWTQTEEEQRADLVRKQQRDELSAGIDQMFKDAPLGMRMLGKMVSPIISSMTSGLAETMKEQQRTVEQVLDDARLSLAADAGVRSVLGEPIQVSSPVSQSSSTTSINGKTQSRVEIVVPVAGSRGSGMARISATEAGLANLQLEANGRLINVPIRDTFDVGTNGSSSSFFGGNSRTSQKPKRDDGIIEAEIIDKESK